MLPDPLRTKADLLERWLLSQPTSENPDDDRQTVRFELSVAAELRRASWHCVAETSAMLPGMTAYLRSQRIDEAQVQMMLDARAALEPEAAGTWLELWNDDIDLGWDFAGVWPVTQTRPWWGAGPEAEALHTWLSPNGLEQCTQVSGSLGAGHRFHAFHFPIPTQGPAPYQVSLAGLDALGLEPLPTFVGEILNLYAHRGYTLSCWFSEEGLVKAGVIVHEPELTLALALCQATGWQDLDRLAAFQAALDMPGPTSVECAYWAEGFDVELSYRV